MSEIFEWAQIEGRLAVPIQSEELSADFIRTGFKWLMQEIYEKVYKDAVQVWKLLPRKMWERYRSWGEFSEHRESVLLAAALNNLKKAVKKKSRPDFFKKGKINGKIKAINKKKNRGSNKEGTRRT